MEATVARPRAGVLNVSDKTRGGETAPPRSGTMARSDHAPAPMTATPASLPSTRLIAPRLSLASCVRAYLARSTMACAPLLPWQRLNRFPASPLCSISWTIQGEAEMAAPVLGAELKIPALLFCGPQSRPTVCYNPGPTQGFMVLFHAAAMHRLSGLDMSAWVDRFAPLDAALGPEWMALARQVQAAPDDDARVALIEHFLEPRWQAARGAEEGRAGVLGDWVKRLGVQVEIGRAHV